MIRPIMIRLAAGLLVAAAAPAHADFSLVTVGDLILDRPVAGLAHQGTFPSWRAFADTLELLHGGDMTYGNLETTILNVRGFKGAPYSWDGDWTLSSEPAVAADLKAMGITLVSRANNHALDWGLEGMRETDRWVARAGLVAAGSGENLSEASSAAFVRTPAGEVALVSMASTFRPTTSALPVSAQAPYGRPGIDGLRSSASAVLDAASYEQVQRIACSFGDVRPCPATASLDLFGTTARAAAAGEAPFTYDYRVSRADVERIAAAVAAAKTEGARFVIVAIHAHEALTDEAPPKSWQDPAAFLRPLAHRMIDAGADAFVVTGIHHVAGIEIYGGKPIFYGIGNFFFSDIQEPLPADLYGSIANRAYGLSNPDLLTRSFEHPGRITDADLTNIMNAAGPFALKDAPAAQNRTFQSFVARSEFDRHGRIREIRLYPIDLGYGEKLTQSGIPRRAGDEVAGMVLDRIIALSQDRGVAIAKVRDGNRLIGVATPLPSGK